LIIETNGPIILNHSGRSLTGILLEDDIDIQYIIKREPKGFPFSLNLH
jgi:hypothetical protein